MYIKVITKIYILFTKENFNTLFEIGDYIAYEGSLYKVFRRTYIDRENCWLIEVEETKIEE